MCCVFYLVLILILFLICLLFRKRERKKTGSCGGGKGMWGRTWEKGNCFQNIFHKIIFWLKIKYKVYINSSFYCVSFYSWYKEGIRADSCIPTWGKYGILGVLASRSPLNFLFRGRNWNLKKEPVTNAEHPKVFALLLSGTKTSSWISASWEQCGMVPVWLWVCYLDAPQLSLSDLSIISNQNRVSASGFLCDLRPTDWCF